VLVGQQVSDPGPAHVVIQHRPVALEQRVVLFDHQPVATLGREDGNQLS